MKIKTVITKKNLKKLEDSIISDMGLFELVNGDKYRIRFWVVIVRKLKKIHLENKHLTSADSRILSILMDTFNIQEVQI